MTISSTDNYRIEPPIEKFPVPSPGRIVLFQWNGEKEPAIVVGVEEPDNPHSRVDLYIFSKPPTGITYRPLTHYSPDAAGCWSWPVYQPPMPLKEE